MKKSSKKERLAGVEHHLKLPDPITEQHLDRFAAESRENQIRILAELRRRTVEDHVEFTVLGLVLSITFAVVAGRLSTAMPNDPIASGVYILIVTLIIGLPIMLLMGVPALLQHGRRADALVLLAAYESELSRRYSARGRSARAWQRSH